jgi:hypothetical protein
MSRLPLSRGLTLGLILVFGALSAAPPDEPAGLKENAEARLKLARKVYAEAEEMLTAPPPDAKVPPPLMEGIDRLSSWSRKWAEAEQDAADTKGKRVAAVQSHVDRMKKWEGVVKDLVGGGAGRAAAIDADLLEFDRLEAEAWLMRTKAE